MEHEKLTELVNTYGLNKSEFESYKKICDDANKAIKELMCSGNIKNFETSLYKVTYSVSDRTTMDEAKLLRVIHANNIPNALGIIKTKEYIDEDALESAIYNGHIPTDVMEQISDCMTVKQVETLRLTERKGE